MLPVLLSLIDSFNLTDAWKGAYTWHSAVSWIVWESGLACQRAVKLAKTAFISNFVSNNVDKPKVLFNVLDCHVKTRDTAPIIPTPALCNDFLNFFIDKISALGFVPSLAAPGPLDPPMCTAVFDHFDFTAPHCQT